MNGRWTSADIPDLTGRTAVVTGANAGLGLEITRQLAGRGARVILACRDQDKAQAAIDDVSYSHPEARLDAAPLDLASLASVRSLADRLTDSEDRLDLLVNNAGLMAVDESRTEDGFEMQFGVNHLGHFALTARLLPLLVATTGARVVTHSSMGHRMGRLHLEDPMYERRRYRRWAAYFQSKLANVLFSRELDRRLRAAGASTVSVAAHPGGSNTDLGTEGSGFLNRTMEVGAPIVAQPAAAGALPVLRAATDPAVRGGEFYGPRYLVRGTTVVRETPSRRARNGDDGRDLWELSERLTAVTAP